MLPESEHKPLPHDLANSIALCRRRRQFLAGLRQLYAAVDADLARRSYECKACGACCDFAKTGHRLHLSTGELALLTEQPPPAAGTPSDRCPYQSGSTCTAHSRRALGCRVFFCDPASRDWSRQTYEAYHHHLRRLHEEHRLPYLYLELTAAVAELGGRTAR